MLTGRAPRDAGLLRRLRATFRRSRGTGRGTGRGSDQLRMAEVLRVLFAHGGAPAVCVLALLAWFASQPELLWRLLLWQLELTEVRRLESTASAVGADCRWFPLASASPPSLNAN